MIRKLRDDEAVPLAPARRYRNGQGYIRLRWPVAPNEYVEAYEHRIVAGRPPASMHVHHINGDRADNRPENLRVVDPTAHGELHAKVERERRANSPRKPTVREMKRARRLARQGYYADRAAVWREQHELGLTQTQIAKAYSVHASQVSRALDRYGLILRDES